MAARPQSGASYSRPVSSFYGEGQHQHAGSGTGGYAASNRDSYINPGAYSSVASLNNPGNRYSTLDPDEQPLVSPDRQQQPAPDIYGDFNNVAPKFSKRYSSADVYAQSGSPTYRNDTRRNSLLQYDDKNFNEDGTSKRNSVAAGELMLTPELGKDLTDEEARRTKVVNDKPIIRGPRLFESMAAGFKRWFEWKRFIFILTAFIGCLVAICYFLVPRAPGFQLAADRPLSSNDRSPTFTRIPAVMNWTAQLNVAIDGRANWIPFHFTSFEMTLYDLDTGKKVGSGGLSDRTSFPGREITPATLDINFYYRGNNASDLTWTNFYNACQHKYQGTTRPNLGLVVQLRSKVRGLIGEKGASTTIPSIACPIELPANNA